MPIAGIGAGMIETARDKFAAVVCGVDSFTLWQSGSFPLSIVEGMINHVQSWMSENWSHVCFFSLRRGISNEKMVATAWKTKMQDPRLEIAIHFSNAFGYLLKVLGSFFELSYFVQSIGLKRRRVSRGHKIVRPWKDTSHIAFYLYVGRSLLFEPMLFHGRPFMIASRNWTLWTAVPACARWTPTGLLGGALLYR